MFHYLEAHTPSKFPWFSLEPLRSTEQQVQGKKQPREGYKGHWGFKCLGREKPSTQPQQQQHRDWVGNTGAREGCDEHYCPIYIPILEAKKPVPLRTLPQ